MWHGLDCCATVLSGVERCQLIWSGAVWCVLGCNCVVRSAVAWSAVSGAVWIPVSNPNSADLFMLQYVWSWI